MTEIQYVYVYGLRYFKVSMNVDDIRTGLCYYVSTTIL